ncbi:outer membrane lipoprotein carrier protein LolA [Candidatus Zixiibacteriota bacterium]
MLKRYVSTLLAVVCGLLHGVVDVSAQTPGTVKVEFERVVVTESAVDSTRGTIYFRAPARTVVTVTYPVNQWMVFDRAAMLIYYPDESRAFRFTSDNPFTLPFFQAFLALAKDDLSLLESGFTLRDSEIRGDTLLTRWNPPAAAKKQVGLALVRHVENRLVAMEVHDTNGKAISRTTYGNHLEYHGMYFPLEIVSEYLLEQSRENVIYHHPQFDSKLPAKIIDFQLPADVDLKIVEW